MFELLTHHISLEAAYVPKYFPGHLVIMRPDDKSWDISLLDDYKWCDVCDSLEIVETHGNHYTVIHNENYEYLVQRMLTHLLLLQVRVVLHCLLPLMSGFRQNINQQM